MIRINWEMLSDRLILLAITFLKLSFPINWHMTARFRPKGSAEKQSGVVGVTWSKQNRSWLVQRPQCAGQPRATRLFSTKLFGEADALQRAISWRRSFAKSDKVEVPVESPGFSVLAVNEEIPKDDGEVSRIVFNVKAKNVYFV